MTQYVIVKRTDIAKLQQKVGRMLADGWMPVGGVSFDGTNYLQAMGR